MSHVLRIKKRNLLIFFGAVFLLLVLLLATLYIRDYSKPQINYDETYNKYAETCAVYFTGIGCPHCAKTDPVLFEEMTKKYKFFVIEYEIYQQEENRNVLSLYNQRYNSGYGIPMLIFNNKDMLQGDRPILDGIDNRLQSMKLTECPLLNETRPIKDIEITALPGKPKIWAKDRILIVKNTETNNEIFRELLATENIAGELSKTNYTLIEPVEVPLSGKSLSFEHAVRIEGNIFQWNGKGVSGKKEITETANESFNGAVPAALTLTKIISLAAVDAINPCALAVMALMLISIMAYDPRNKRNVLLAGLSFTTAVFVIYLFYGVVMVKFFQAVQFLTTIRLALYNILGFLAILLGILNIRDYFYYKPGGLATEMPLSWRPSMKKLVSSVTSPKGAFVVGAFVTIFLLPCTIGPYIIASGILSYITLIKTLPWLLLYNFVFVIPMLLITFGVYFGFARVQEVSGWKDRNIRKLHLAEGIILLLLGAAMLFGLA